MTPGRAPGAPSRDPHREDPAEWGPWTEVGDREELRRRLERLAEADNLAPAHDDFVRFFFRASDPVLYPLAAVTLGRQAVASSEAASWLAEYARRRRIAIQGRIPLGGRRSDRRVLLAAAGAVARDSTGWLRIASSGGSGEGPEDPLVPLPAEVPTDGSDLATYLRACRILLGGAAPSEALLEHVDAVLEETARRATLADPPVAARWGELLDARGAVGSSGSSGGPEKAVELGVRVLGRLRARLEASEPTGLGSRLSLLRAMRGLVEGAGGLIGPLDALPGSATGTREAVAEAVRRLADPREWWGYEERERARTAFLLLDGSPGARLPARELRALLDAFDFPPSARTAARVLLLLAAREGVEPGELVDVTLLHSLEDEAVLLQLVPTGPPGDSGAAVADALEHRLRMGLATEPGFRPEELLLRVEARRPHPAFFQLLRVVTTDREYSRPDGTEVPISSWLEALHQEARSLREGAGRIPTSPPIPGAIGEARERVRHELSALQRSDEPSRLLHDLAAILHGTADEADHASERDVHALLGILEGEGAGLLERSLHRRAAALRREGDRIVPDVLRGVPDARAAGEVARGHLREFVEELAPRLPGAEGVLLETAALRLEAEIEEWLEVLVRLEAVWRGGAEEADEVAAWGSMLRSAAAVGNEAHRGRLLPLVWRTLAGAPRGDGAGSGRQERLIRWGARSGSLLSDEDDRSVWLEAVAHQWGAMVQAGIEAGLETRVARLVREPGPETLVRLPGVDTVLERTRVWFFDCYRIEDAARITGILNERRGRGGVSTLPRDLLAFFLHYSPVWLALLVGAILMLDFGDAWTAMAEVGDVRGIGITFALGVVGAFGYVTAELHSRVRDAPGDHVWANRGRRFLRTLAFVGVCLAYTLGVVGLLWWLLSGTDEVVHGAGAVLHVVVWSGFALFVGVFFGLLAKSG